MRQFFFHLNHPLRFTFLKFIFAAIFSLQTITALAQSTPLYLNSQWLKLLHYKPHPISLGQSMGRSQVQNAAFFLSPEGATNPESELKATLSAFQSPEIREFSTPHPTRSEKVKQHPICQFPARKVFILDQYKKNPDAFKPYGFMGAIAPVVCKEFNQFEKTLEAKSISLVFSSYFTNSPASAFGHTFLRVSKTLPTEDPKNRLELLDHSINFAAEVETSNPISYAWNGLSGGFKGLYTVFPYYLKVREYNDFESRDLWSYELNLTQKEVDLVVAHAWELLSAQFDYFYLSQNCSFHILTLLEAALEDTSFTEKLSRFYVVPADTLKAVTLNTSRELVSKIHYRPSIRSTFFYRYSLLSENEQKSVDTLIFQHLNPLEHDVSNDEDPNVFTEKNGKLVAKLPESNESKRKVLDTALDWTDYHYAHELLSKKNKENENSAALQFKDYLLNERLKISETTPPLVVPTPEYERPDSAHASSRIQYTLSSAQNARSKWQSRSTLQWRFALQDLLDQNRGFPEWTQNELGKAEVSFLHQTRRLRFERFSLIDLTSLTPNLMIDPKKAWRFHLGVIRTPDPNCYDCVVLQSEGGMGYAFAPGLARNAVLFALFDASIEAGNLPSSKVRLGIGPRYGWITGTESLRWLVEGWAHYLVFSHTPFVYQIRTEVRYHIGNNLETALSAQNDPTENRFGVSALWHL